MLTPSLTYTCEVQRREDELLRALFAPGVTTRTDVTTTSGRGIGLSGIHEEVLGLGGTVSVASEPQRGPCWTFSLPLSEKLPFYSARSCG